MKYYVVKSTKTTEGEGRTFLKNNLVEPELEEL